MAEPHRAGAAFQIGLYTFAECAPDPKAGGVGPAERLRNLVEEIALADQVGLDWFGVGEHHRPDYAVSRPAVALAAGAPATRHIRLSSAVTVLGSDDPVRVCEEFAMLDNLTQGRAEIMAGRGAFVESFPLHGLALQDYESLFEEKLALLLRLAGGGPVTWPGGRHTRPIEGRSLFP